MRLLLRVVLRAGMLRLLSFVVGVVSCLSRVADPDIGLRNPRDGRARTLPLQGP